MALYRIRHDFELDPPHVRPSLRPGHGLPETVKMYDNRWTVMSEAWQWYMFDLLCLAKFGHWNRDALTQEQFDYLARAFTSLYKGDRFRTNKNGVNDHNNHVTGEMTGEEPKTEPITTGGNIVDVIGGPYSLPGGGIWMKVRTIGGARPPRIEEVNQLTHPELVHTATIVRLEEDGSHRVIQFPQLDGVSVPFPNISAEDHNYIRLERLERLPEGSPIPSPYWPQAQAEQPEQHEALAVEISFDPPWRIEIGL